jgi:hypothetical protein
LTPNPNRVRPQVGALRALFAIRLDLHTIEVTGGDEVTARWTMAMEPRVPGPLKPSLLFTGALARGAAGAAAAAALGRAAAAAEQPPPQPRPPAHLPTPTPTPPPPPGTSRYRVDPGSGLVLEHVDTWDAVRDSSFGSPEALLHVAGQLAQVQLTPDLEGPRFAVLRRAAGYEVRRYEPYVVAATDMGAGAGARPGRACQWCCAGREPPQLLPAAPPRPPRTHRASTATPSRPPAGPAGGAGFNALAGYIFGGNQSGAKMEMTTPVITSPAADGASMQFVMEPSRFSSPEQLPEPKDARVERRAEAGGFVAAVRFSGWPFEWEVAAQEAALRRALQADGLAPEAGYQLARYNDPLAPPFLRRNEVLIRLRGFDWPPPQ